MLGTFLIACPFHIIVLQFFPVQDNFHSMIQTDHQKDIYIVQTINLEKNNVTYLILITIWTQISLKTIVND